MREYYTKKVKSFLLIGYILSRLMKIYDQKFAMNVIMRFVDEENREKRDASFFLAVIFYCSLQSVFIRASTFQKKFWC